MDGFLIELEHLLHRAGSPGCQQALKPAPVAALTEQKAWPRYTSGSPQVAPGNAFMDVISALAAIVEATCDRWLAPGSPYSAYSYVGAIMVIAAIFVARRRRSGIPATRFWRSAFPTRIWGHPSTRLDAWMYVWNFMLLSAAYGSVSCTSAFWFEHADASLQMVAGSPWFPNAPVSLVLVFTALAEVLLVDFGYWIAHYYMHRTEVLWEFHKVHHSAEVMTPLTEMRQHPIEMILFPNVIALMIGLGYAVLKQLFGAAQPLTLMNVNVFLLIFFVTYSHLRHSHVWLPFTGWIGHVLHSPAPDT